MRVIISVCAAIGTGGSASLLRGNDNALVRSHVESHANETFRNASGYLKYPYLVPSGPYTEAWDWDSM
jgi:hypothetical protein